MDPVKFIDLESTMRMLYDHGNMKFESAPDSDAYAVVNSVNASMREPKRAHSSAKAANSDK